MPDEEPNKAADNTATFMLEGDVPLAALAEGLSAFNKPITGLSDEAGGNIEWTIYELNYSSAITVVQGISPEPEKVHLRKDGLEQI